MKSIAIATVTFKELVREKILHGLLVVFALISIFSLVLGQLSFAEQVRLSMDFGLSIMHITLIGLAILLGCQLIQKELDRKTIFTLLVKPIHRYEYIFGKFLGLCGILLFVLVICMVFQLITMRFFGQFYFREILTAGIGQGLEACFLVSLVLLLNQFMRSAVTAFCGVALFLVGHWFETLTFFAEKNPAAGFGQLHLVLSFLFPNLENWNWKGLVVYGEFLSSGDIFLAFAQAVVWIVSYLLIAAFLFQRRDLVI